MSDTDEIRETLIAAEACLELAIRQTTSPSGEVGAAFDDFQGAIWMLRKWRLALETGVWTGQEPAAPRAHGSLSSRSRVAASKVALRRSEVV